ncbi:OLC1v1038981C1 [Oldenlandia corymbosa var. corymbosa]|uniref:OLC1v1038981C1 n=1 Tax=Oldenlandia corymbosa var. corymbosa TaxID=529605 RepID=A0AAV1D123_OLDCO|nr:OLC1v1038981C1 [Oldenlandia corymbosa var. corymbosa]
MDLLVHPILTLIITLFVVLFTTFAALASKIYIGKSIRNKKYPPVVGTVFHQLLYLNRLYDFQAEMAKTQPTVRLLGVDQSEIYTTDPANVEHVLKTNFHKYSKGKYNQDIVSDLFGQGIFAVDGEKWRQQRKLASFEFSTRVLRDFSCEVFRRNAAKLARKVSEFSQAGQVFDLQDLLMRCTLDSIFKVGFGVDLNCLQGSGKEATEFIKAFDDSNELTYWRYVDPFWQLKRYFNIGSEAILRKNVMVIRHFVDDLIRNKRNQIDMQKDYNAKEDILSRFVVESRKDPENMSDQYLRDIILNFMIAGKDTTANTLSWFFYMLCQNTSIQERVAEEIGEVIGKQESKTCSIDDFVARITDETMDKMHCTHATLTETLRLFPAVPVDGRCADADDVLPDGYEVKKGDGVYYMSYAMARMPYIWGDDAEEFRPERWLQNGIFQPQSPFKFVAFHAGPRICLGKDFAYRQMKILAMTLLHFFKFRMSNEAEKVTYRTMFTLHIKEGLHIQAIPRTDERAVEEIDEVGKFRYVHFISYVFNCTSSSNQENMVPKFDFTANLVALVSAFICIGFALFAIGVVVSSKILENGGKKNKKRFHPIGGTMLHQLANFNRLHHYMTDLAGKYKTYRLISPFRNEVYTSDPANVEYILKTNFENYGKGLYQYTILKDLLGDGIFAVDGDKWREQRKIASYEFSTKVLRDFSSVIFRKNVAKVANIISKAADSKQSFDIQDLLMKSALDSIFKVAFGVDLDSMCGSNEEGKKFSCAFDDASALSLKRYVDIFWKIKKALNVGSEAKLRENIKVVDDFVYKLIKSKTEQMHKSADDSSWKKDDILSRFLRVTETDSRYLRDVILSFIIAGKDTTATTLSWLIYMLCKHPNVQEKIAQEIKGSAHEQEITDVAEFAARLSDDSMENMHYLHAALTEILRLYPAVPVTCLNHTCLLIFASIYSTPIQLENSGKWWEEEEEEISSDFLDRLISPFRNEVYTSDPANVDYILKTNFENYSKWKKDAIMSRSLRGKKKIKVHLNEIAVEVHVFWDLSISSLPILHRNNSEARKPYCNHQRRPNGQNFAFMNGSCRAAMRREELFWFIFGYGHAFRLLPAIFRSFSKLKLHTHTAQRNPGGKLSNKSSFLVYSEEGIYKCNLQLRNLGKVGKVNEARKLFDEMTERNVVSYASMITIYLKHNNLPKAESLYLGMPERSVVADSAMVHAYAKLGRLEFAREIFDHMPTKNVFTWTGLISGYLQYGRVDEACRLFREMPEKNEISWTTMLLGLARNGLIDRARETFNQIPDKNVVSWTAMISAYVENCQVDSALQLFYQMPHPNLYSWNIIIKGCLDYDKATEALQLFNSIPERNAVSWTTMITGLADKGCIDLARKYFDQMPNKDIVAWNAMITAYADKDNMVEASYLFNAMPTRNTVTWNTMINGYAKNGPQDQALKLFILMLRSSQRANVIALTCILIACQGIFQLQQSHALVIQLGFELETSLINALVTMYSKSGDLSSARLAFDNLEAKDVFSWTAIILSYSNHGYGNLALVTFAQMLRSGIEPDEVTFLGVLSACSHAGLVKKGKKLFLSMNSAYDIHPNKDHYCCLVDILGRAGMINEAVEVISQMPPGECDGAVIGALLGSCKLHGDEVAQVNILGEKLLELEPSISGSYVLLSNLFAASGQWDDFALVRKKMKDSGVHKVPGYSQIEVKGENHVFYAGDRSHNEIYQVCHLLKEKLLPVMLDKHCILESCQ